MKRQPILVAFLLTNSKPIEEIQVGDKVLAYDEETGGQAYKKVVQLFRNQTNEWYHIFANGEEIVCTGGHPFYVAELDKFIPARELAIGAKLLLSTGVCAIIEAIEVDQLSAPETTYNFEVEDFHTYYVTENKMLVHNMCSTLEADDILSGIIDDPQSIQDYSLDEIKSIANQSNWHQGTLVRGPNKGLGFKVSSSSKGSIIFNPGQSHHFGGAAYWKVSSSTKGVSRFLYLR